MKAFERLLKYAAIRTPSDEESDTVPSSACQFELAQHLYRELFTMGITDVKVDTQCYLYTHIPATPGYEGRPKLGFIAHLDTVSDFCDHRIIPEIHEDYNGRELPLGTSGRVLSPDMFPHLKDLKGRTLITSDGTTILGADDKAGISEIMTMAERILDENIPHGPISIAFTPDEEIGMGAAHFDVEEFGADFAYTLDGDTEGEIQYENFNAAKAEFEISGVNVHPGSSKDIMVNASLVAMEINSMLPEGETPRDTEGYEGFYHLIDMKGDVGHAVLRYIIRDHDAAKFEERKETLRNYREKDQSEMGPRHCFSHYNRPVPQHGGNHCRLYAPDRKRKESLPECRRHTADSPHPGRYRRRPAKLQRTALSQSGNRRPRISRTLRAYHSRRHGRSV